MRGIAVAAQRIRLPTVSDYPPLYVTSDWNDSGLEGQLKAILPNENAMAEDRYCLYGDLTCWPAIGVVGPFRPQNPQGVLSREERAANLTMSSVQISVEWVLV